MWMSRSTHNLTKQICSRTSYTSIQNVRHIVRCYSSTRVMTRPLNGHAATATATAGGNEVDNQDIEGIIGTADRQRVDDGSSDWVRGQILDLAADLRTFRPGDKLDIPYELTVSESMQDFWQSAFHSQDRIHTSRPFCRKMGLQDRVLPFSLALTLTSSMTHADAAKVQVGYGRVHYLWPAFAGDTFTKTFTVESIRNTSDGNHSIVQLTCDLINQRGRLCMRADKRMLFEFSVPDQDQQQQNQYDNNYHNTSYTQYAQNGGSNGSRNSSSSSDGGISPPNLHLFRDHLLSKSNVCQALQSHSLAELRPGQLILHSLNRSLTFTQSQQLASLARLTHEKHFDCRKYDISELLIPGGLVLGISMSASARDFHELLHEEIINANYVNSLHPGNMVSAISYIHSVEEVVGDLQVVTVRTLGIKNMDVKKDLDGMDLPMELFDMSKPMLKSKDIQNICKAKCPLLYNKIIVQVDRRLLRQARHHEVFLL